MSSWGLSFCASYRVRVWSFEVLGVEKRSWLAQVDDFRTFLGEFVLALPQVEFPSG
jgi:hypothetical protein